MTQSPLAVVALISGRGSNLQAIIDAAADGSLPAVIRAVISNRPGADGLGRAARAGIPTTVVDHTRYPDRAGFDAALQQAVDRYQPALVVLAGFMRVLTPDFVAHYHGRMLNIHPSLLPRFRGLHTHERALAEGATEHGASVHFVTDDLDGGPVVLQARVPVLAGDTPERLAARVLVQEHRIYPEVIRWVAEGLLRMEGGQVLLDGAPLSSPRLLGAQ